MSNRTVSIRDVRNIEKTGKIGEGATIAAQFSRLYKTYRQRHHPFMSNLEVLFTFVSDLIRTLLIEVVSDRVRGLRKPKRMQGMKEVRRHVHRCNRRRLLNQISTALRR